MENTQKNNAKSGKDLNFKFFHRRNEKNFVPQFSFQVKRKNPFLIENRLLTVEMGAKSLRLERHFPQKVVFFVRHV